MFSNSNLFQTFWSKAYYYLYTLTYHCLIMFVVRTVILLFLLINFSSLTLQPYFWSSSSEMATSTLFDALTRLLFFMRPLTFFKIFFFWWQKCGGKSSREFHSFFLLAVDAEANQEKKPNDEEQFFICKLSAMIYRRKQYFYQTTLPRY